MAAFFFQDHPVWVFNGLPYTAIRDLQTQTGWSRYVQTCTSNHLLPPTSLLGPDTQGERTIHYSHVGAHIASRHVLQKQPRHAAEPLGSLSRSASEPLPSRKKAWTSTARGFCRWPK